MSAPVAQALLSVSDKSGLVEFARGLAAHGIKLLSTGGTAKTLAAAGLAVTDVGSYTEFPEMLDGRVKTLHPKIHGGILARRDLPAHVAALREHAIPTIDLVVINLYPFRETVAKPGCTLEDAVENIDIGGPAMVRAAAKNWPHVGIVVDPSDYPAILAELAANGRSLTDATRFRLMRKAFAHTASYDSAIANWLGARGTDGVARGFPDSFHFAGDKVQDMRYGENPHQSAAFYRDETPAPGHHCHVPAIAGQGALVQQRGRQRCGVGVREDVRRAGVRDRQARESLRRRDCRHAARRLSAGIRHRSHVGVRRHHRLQPAGGRCRRRRGRRAISRSADRTGVHGGRARADRQESQCARTRSAAAGAERGGQCVGHETGRRRLSRPIARRPQRRGRRIAGRDPARADTGAEEGSAVRVARGQVRQVQCDRLLPRRAHARHRRRPDEPRGFDQDRGDQGRRARDSR